MEHKREANSSTYSFFFFLEASGAGRCRSFHIEHIGKGDSHRLDISDLY